MADLTVDGTSDYGTGGIDTASTLVNNVSPTDAANVNGPAEAIVEMQGALGSGSSLKGNLTTLVARLAKVFDANGVISATAGDASIVIEDSRTNTTDTVLTLTSTTSGTPAADIGTGVTFRAESADENPSDVGHASFNFSDVSAGSEDSYFNIWLRVAGAGLASRWRMSSTGSAAGTVTHANTTSRLYTFPDASMTVVGHDTTQTLTNKTLGSTNTLTACVKTGSLATATGSATGNDAGAVDLTMNDYAFFPATFSSDSGRKGMSSYAGTDPSNTTGRLSLDSGGGGTGVTKGVRWRYITASDMPEIWVAYHNTTGQVYAVWTSDDPPPGGVPGVVVQGCTSVRLTAKDLEPWSILSTKASEADAWIRDQKLRAQHQAYRALQLLTGDKAPSPWLYENCVYVLGKNTFEVKPNARVNEGRTPVS